MKLSELCDTQSGYTARTRLEPTKAGGVPAVQLRDLEGENDFDPSIAQLYALDASFERYWVQSGDVLFRSRGDRNTAVALDIESNKAAVAILPLIILRPDPATIDSRYLAWFINQPPAQRYFDGCAQGQSLRMVSKKCLDDLEVSVPDLETQQRIVEISRLSQREGELLNALAEKKKMLTSFVLLEQVRKAQLHGYGAGRSVARRTRNPSGKSERTTR